DTFIVLASVVLVGFASIRLRVSANAVQIGDLGGCTIARDGFGAAGGERRLIHSLELQRELVDDLALAFGPHRQRGQSRSDVRAPVDHAGLTPATRSSASKKSRQTRRR